MIPFHSRQGTLQRGGTVVFLLLFLPILVLQSGIYVKKSFLSQLERKLKKIIKMSNFFPTYNSFFFFLVTLKASSWLLGWIFKYSDAEDTLHVMEPSPAPCKESLMIDTLLIFQAARKGRSLTSLDHLFQCLEVFTVLKNIFLLDK